MKTINILFNILIILLNFNLINSGLLLKAITNSSNNNKLANTTHKINNNTTTTTISPLKIVPRSEKQTSGAVVVTPAANNSSNIVTSKRETIESNTSNTNNILQPRKLSTTTKKVYPKKYAPISSINAESGPTKIILPKSISNSISFSEDLVCPKENEAQFNLFAPSCETDNDCNFLKKEQKCCKVFGSKSCTQGIPRPVEDHPHNPLLGFIPRRCPEVPLAELWWDLKQCETDNECWPRICCPDGHKKFCKAPTIEYSSMPLQLGRPLAYLSEYLECTPPPPPIFDLHPKKCESTLDCFPNVCCQETGKKHCRPPKKSVLTFMANFLNIGLVKRLTANIVIK